MSTTQAPVARTHERPGPPPGGTRTPATMHVPALDGLRGLAILAVVAFHVAVVMSDGAPWAYRTLPPVYSWPAFAGSLGVDLFFVLSGFLVLRSWQGIRERNRADGIRSVVEFARRRGRRILPPYWVALAVLVVWRAPEWLSSLHGWRNIGMFVSLNQFLDPGLPQQLNTVTWSLTTETHFYVLVPLLALAGARLGWRKTLALTIALTVAWRIAHGGTGGPAEWIIGRADQFVAGMGAASVVAAHAAGRRTPLARWLTGPWAGRILWAALALLALAHGGLRLAPKPLAFLVLLHPVAGLAMAGLLARGLMRGSISRLEAPVIGPPLRWLGVASYSLYLWHWPLLAEATGAWGPSVPVVGAALAAGLAVSALSYRFLEKPFTKPASASSASSIPRVAPTH